MNISLDEHFDIIVCIFDQYSIVWEVTFCVCIDQVVLRDYFVVKLQIMQDRNHWILDYIETDEQDPLNQTALFPKPKKFNQKWLWKSGGKN